MLRFIAYGWVPALFGAPTFHFKYWGARWVQAPPDPWLYASFWLLAGLALSFAVGLLFRWTSGLFVLGFAYLQLIDATNYLNHYYLAVLLGVILCISPAARVWSFDAALRRWRSRDARPAGEPRTHAAAWLYLFRFQVGLVYFFAGLGKLQSDWLFAGQPLGIWLASQGDSRLLPDGLGLDTLSIGMSWAGFLFDTTIPLWLSWQRTRVPAYAAVVVFHVLTGALFPIGMFPVIMMVCALVFFPPDWPRRAWRWVLARRGAPRVLPVMPVKDPEAPPPGLLRRRLVMGVGLIYAVVQITLPLRFLAYGGNVSWHEQGMRWSWRVMVREKNGSVTFRVESQGAARTWEISPSRYLTRLQEREMAGQPELILQLAHHVRDDFVRRGLGPVRVFADAWVSLNGRRAARLIHPGVDLARTRDGLGRAEWILPAPTSPPSEARPSAQNSN